jgi:YHS domain-containing protein
MKRRLLSAVLLCLTCKVLAQPINVNATDGLALEGYDPVSYYEEGGPELGSGNHTATYQGIIYQFASERHRKAFEEDPRLFLPAYGGWCAFAMGIDGDRVEVDPETYKIKDGRLFLFYNSFLNNTMKKWEAREKELLARADINWNNQVANPPK